MQSATAHSQARCGARLGVARRQRQLESSLMDLSGPYDAIPAECVSCHIYEDGKGRWHWEGVDALAAVVKHSQRGFDTRAQCLADALKHGQPLPDSALVF